MLVTLQLCIAHPYRFLGNPKFADLYKLLTIYSSAKSLSAQQQTIVPLGAIAKECLHEQLFQ